MSDIEDQTPTDHHTPDFHSPDFHIPDVTVSLPQTVPSRSTLRTREKRARRSMANTEPGEDEVQCVYRVYSCPIMFLASHLGNHQQECLFFVPDNVHNAFNRGSYTPVDGIESHDLPYRIPQSEFWKPNNLTAYEVYREVIRFRKPHEDRLIDRAGKDFSWPEIVLQMFMDPPSKHALCALNIPPPTTIKDSFMVPRALSEGVFYREIMAATINATPRGTFVDLHIDRGFSTVAAHIVGSPACTKVWALFPPTVENRSAYLEVAQRADGERFFGIADKLSHGRMAITGPGWGLFLPAGWLHCVYTISSGLLVGTNFATADSMDEFGKSVQHECIWNRSDSDVVSTINAFAVVIYHSLIDGSPNVYNKGIAALDAMYSFHIADRLRRIKRWPQEIKDLISLSVAGTADGLRKGYTRETCLCGKILTEAHVKEH